MAFFLGNKVGPRNAAEFAPTLGTGPDAGRNHAETSEETPGSTDLRNHSRHRYFEAIGAMVTDQLMWTGCNSATLIRMK
jgi:hypothetical protein